MNTLLLLAALLMGPAPDQAEKLDEAAGLYREGSVMFDAADYDGAIDKFTRALGIVAALDAQDETRLMLLYNIASAHEKQFEIDKDVEHLRQALALYKRYLEFAQSTGDLGEELDVAPRITRLEKRVKVADQLERNRANAEKDDERDVPPPPPGTAGPDQLDWKKPRNTGIGLVVAGSGLAVGGVIMAIVGSGYEAHAREEVNKLADLGVPMDHPAWMQGGEFIAEEKRKGNALMGVGATMAVVGAAGIGVGSYYLVKSKRMKEGVAVVPALSPGFAGIQLSGKF